MNAINDFLLNLFTGSDAKLRPSYICPNLKNGIVSATDGCVLIQIPNECLTLSYNTNNEYPDTNKIINYIEGKKLIGIKVKVSDIAKELTRARLNIDKDSIECKECNGTGAVEWGYQDKHCESHLLVEECPICNGEGSLRTDGSFARVRFDAIIDKDTGLYSGIYIGDLYFHPFQLYRLFMVALVKGYTEIEIMYNEENYGTTITYFGEIKVVIMLMEKPDKEIF